MAEGKRFDSNRWFRQTVDQRTWEALMAQEQQFIAEHARDTDEQLAALIRTRARELRHSPQALEVTGSLYMTERFGSWEKALAAADQHTPRGTIRFTRTDRFRAEYRRQSEILRVEQEQKKAHREARNAALAAKKKERED